MLTEKAKEILKGVETKMGDTVSFLEEDLKTYRVGKANPSILNKSWRYGSRGRPAPVDVISTSGMVPSGRISIGSAQLFLIVTVPQVERW